MKPKLLIVSDSPMIDTGFGRVGREIATSLALTGKYDVTYFAWFHRPYDKLVPFKIIPTDMSNKTMAEADKYGQLSYDHVIERVKPDLVLAIGDQWMISHYLERPRDYVLAGYLPIDGAPLMKTWLPTIRGLDQLILYGEFGEQVVKAGGGKEVNIRKIPHGVDVDIFAPLTGVEKQNARRIISPDPKKFIIGCVARNNTRKQLPRLLKAFRQFLNPWTACSKCGHVAHANNTECQQCNAPGGMLRHGKGREDVLLYLHCSPDDSAGHQLLPLLERFRLNGYVGMPENLQIGRGVPDEQLNLFYNAFDLFTLPTGGEGWGLPILEAMSSGCPVLVTDYSAHQEFVQGAGEFISVKDWWTNPNNNVEWALVDLDDYVMKMDRFYLEPADFIFKWGTFMLNNGYPEDQLEKISTGKKLREGMSTLARERALEYSWPPIHKQWDDLIWELLPEHKKSGDFSAAQLKTEVIS